MSTFSSMKKNRGARKTKLRDRVERESSKTSYEDSRIWSCQRDKAGLGQATVRFLQPSEADIKFYVEQMGYDAEDVPFWVSHHQHGFKGPNGKWFINNCPTSIEKDCPICEANSEIVESNGGWDSMDDNHPGKKLVRNRKRKETFYTNVLIIDDKSNPENNGRVMIFKYGPAIQKQILGQLIPEFDDEESCDVSDFWEGRDFKLKITKKDGYTNYDKSTWGESSAISDDDEEIESIWNKQFKLSDFITDDKYKEYDALVKEFERTQGAEEPKRKSVDQGDDSGDGGADEPQQEPKATKARRNPGEGKAASKPAAKSKPAPAGDDDVDNDDYFASLLDD